MKTTYRMEMSRPGDFNPKEGGPDLDVIRVEHPYGELSKFMHTLVGHPWRWGGHRGWRQQQWDEYCTQPGFEMWLALHEGTPVGYAEMVKHENGTVQIKTMGLAPGFVGKGLGGPLLSAVVKRAWELTETTVWLSTCSHDHPKAKDNYEARGFKVVEAREEEQENEPIPSFWDLVEAGDRAVE